MWPKPMTRPMAVGGASSSLTERVGLGAAADDDRLNNEVESPVVNSRQAGREGGSIHRLLQKASARPICPADALFFLTLSLLANGLPQFLMMLTSDEGDSDK